MSERSSWPVWHDDVSLARRAGLVAGVLALLFAVSPHTASAIEPFEYGYNDASFLPEDGLDPGLAADAARASGATVQRFVIYWNRVQPQQGVWNWSQYDDAIEEIHARGIELLLVVGASPSWARPLLCAHHWCPPDQSQYGAWHSFVREVVERYQHALAGIEVWNEPNFKPYWQGLLPPDGRTYAFLFNAAAAGVNEADPDLPIVTGGVTYIGGESDGFQIQTIPTFMNRFFTNVDRSRLDPGDLIGVHAYPAANEIETLDTQYGTIMSQIRAVRDGRSPGRRILVTETGASTALGFTEANQADVLVNINEDLRPSGDVAGMIVHTLPETLEAAAGDREYGVLRRTPSGLSPKLAYCALAQANGQAPPPVC